MAFRARCLVALRVGLVVVCFLLVLTVARPPRLPIFSDLAARGSAAFGPQSEDSILHVLLEGYRSYNQPKPSVRFCVPTTGNLTQRLSHTHYGLDIAGPAGASPGNPVYAAYDGVVRYVGIGESASDIPLYNPNRIRHTVVIDHGLIDERYVLSLYAHMGSNQTSFVDAAIQPGEPVKQGQLLGYQGSAGFSTGEHLHFEIRENHMPYDVSYSFGFDPALSVDPQRYIGTLWYTAVETCSA